MSLFFGLLVDHSLPKCGVEFLELELFLVLHALALLVPARVIHVPGFR